jgi:hypothetical protein
MGIPTLSTIFSQVIRNVKTVSHPENTTVHKHLDARSHKGCIVIGSNPVLTTKIKNKCYELPKRNKTSSTRCLP